MRFHPGDKVDFTEDAKNQYWCTSWLAMDHAIATDYKKLGYMTVTRYISDGEVLVSSPSAGFNSTIPEDDLVLFNIVQRKIEVD